MDSPEPNKNVCKWHPLGCVDNILYTYIFVCCVGMCDVNMCETWRLTVTLDVSFLTFISHPTL